MFFFFYQGCLMCVYEIWQMLLTPLPDVKKQSSGEPTDAGRHWTKFGHGWTKFGKWWALQPWWWVGFKYHCLQRRWCLIAMLSTCKHHCCCKVVFERQTCMLCVKLTPEFPTLNSLWIVIGGIHQVFATPKRIVCFACEKLPCLFNFLIIMPAVFNLQMHSANH